MAGAPRGHTDEVHCTLGHPPAQQAGYLGRAGSSVELQMRRSSSRRLASRASSAPPGRILSHRRCRRRRCCLGDAQPGQPRLAAPAAATVATAAATHTSSVHQRRKGRRQRAARPALSGAPPAQPAPSLGAKEDAAFPLSGFSHPVLDRRAGRSVGSADSPSSPPLLPEALRAAAGSGRCRCCGCCRRRRAGSPEGWGAGARRGADWAPTFLRLHLLLRAGVFFPAAHAVHPGAPKLCVPCG